MRVQKGCTHEDGRVGSSLYQGVSVADEQPDQTKPAQAKSDDKLAGCVGGCVLLPFGLIVFAIIAGALQSLGGASETDRAPSKPAPQFISNAREVEAEILNRIRGDVYFAGQLDGEILLDLDDVCFDAEAYPSGDLFALAQLEAATRSARPDFASGRFGAMIGILSATDYCFSATQNRLVDEAANYIRQFAE